MATLFGCALFVLLGAWSGLSRGQETLSVGLYQNEPKVYRDAEGAPAGLFVELLDEVARIEGWQLNYVSCQWRDCLEKLHAGELDLMPDVAATPSRREALSFHSLPVLQAWSQVYAPPHTGFNGFDRLDGERLAVLEGSAQQTYLEALKAAQDWHFDLVEREDMHSVLASVADGRADAAVSNNFYGGRHARDHGLVETPLTFDQVSLFFAASAEAPPQMVFDRLDHHLLQWKAESDSPYFRAVERALAAPTTYVVSPWMVLALTGVAAIALLLAAFSLLLRWRVRSRTRQLTRSNARLQRLLESAPVMLYALRGADLKLAWVSGNIQRILGFQPAEALALGWWQSRIHPEDRPGAAREAARIHHEHHVVREYRMHDAAGKIRYVRDECQYRPSGNERSEAEWIGTLTDLTTDFEQREELNQLAHYDARTGLPNRVLLQRRIDETLARAQGEGTPRFLLLLNLDRFKAVNESLGLAAGDQVLQSVARRLTGLVGPGDTVARVGADEFCVMPNGPLAQAQIEQYGDRLLSLFEGPLRVAGREIVLTASIGFAQYPRDGRQRDELISAAELALEAAKRAGGNCLRAFEPGLSNRMRRRLFLEIELRQALVKDQLLLHFQPQYELKGGQLVGLEALVRWAHPERGTISPGEFVPLAEEIGLIEHIDRWVLGEAARQLAAWDAEGVVVPRVSVNLSARELHVPGLVSFIQQVLAENGLSPQRLELEITETMLMAYPGQALQTLRQLAATGVRLSMDDFGTGYSNLAYLRRLPLHQLKVDQSFVKDIGRSRHNESIIEAIIALSRALELELVAEGVETPEQRDFLRRAGCMLGQGFLFSRPIAASEVVNLLADADGRGCDG